MSEMILAAELVVGDVYRDFRPHGGLFPGGPEVREVTSKRRMRFGHDVEVLETISTDGLARKGVGHIRSDAMVERLERVEIGEIEEILRVLKSGASVTATYFDGGFWI